MDLAIAKMDSNDKEVARKKEEVQRSRETLEQVEQLVLGDKLALDLG